MRWYLGFCWIMMAGTLAAQTDPEVWPLRKCIDHAWQNSLQVKQSDLSILQSQLSQKQAFWSQFPTASANIRHSANFGRSIDLTSYDFVNDIVQMTSFSANVNAPLYQGLQIRNSIKQTKIDVQAAQQDLQQVRNDLALSVAQAYLTVLLAEENKQVLEEQHRVTQSQYERTLKLIAAGTLADNTRFDLEAQLASEDEGIVRAQNNITLAYLNLKTQMNLDVGKEIRIDRPELPLPESVQQLTLEELYQDAASRMPNMVAARMRESSADLGVRIAKGALQPSLAAFASLSTNYSSSGKEVTGTDTVYQQLSFDMGGVPINVEFPQQIPVYSNKPFFDQFGDNISFGIGVNLQIPIFNGLRARIGIERAKLSVETAKLNTRRIEVQLKGDIQRALLDAQAAEQRLRAAEKTLVSVRAAVENTRKRFELGVVNGFELTSVQNRLVSAESNVIQAKYDYIFKLKILDYYRGIEISL